MKNNYYDECQLINRQKIAFQALLITLILVFLNGMIATFHEWATPMIQAIVIIQLAMGYFVTCAVFKNAYLGLKSKNSYGNSIIFALLGLSNVAVSYSALTRLGAAHLISGGKLSDAAGSLLSGIFFLYVSAVILIKVLLDRRKSEDA